MKIKTVYLCIALVIITSNLWADEIWFTDSDNMKTEIIDTNGCEVKIMRNRDTVTIRKSIIEKIIWKTDTISYSGYVCAKKTRRVFREEDTPEYQLMLIFDNAKETYKILQANSRIAFLYSPLQGSYNSEEFAGLQAPLVDLFKQKASASLLSPTEMLNEIVSEQHNFDYVFVARKYHVVKNDIQHGGFWTTASVFQNEEKMKKLKEPEMVKDSVNLEKKKELVTISDFILFDIAKREIIFRKKMVEKRSVWGEKDYYTWTEILAPDEWKKEWEKKQVNRKLDRNAQAIRKKMEKEISEYLGIKD